MTTTKPDTDREERTRRRLLRRVSIAEGTSFLVLLVASVVKRTQGSEVGVEVLGPLHGILFIAYVLIIVFSWRLIGWTLFRMIGAILLGIVPFGAFWVERAWLRERPDHLRRHR